MRLAWWVGEVEKVEGTEEWKERRAAMEKSAGKEATLGKWSLGQKRYRQLASPVVYIIPLLSERF